jgi:hypothetical protein
VEAVYSKNRFGQAKREGERASISLVNAVEKEGGAETTKTKFTAIVRNQRSPFEGEYGRIVSRKLGEFMGKRIEVVVREVE